MQMVDKVVVYSGKTVDTITAKIGEFSGSEAVFSFDSNEYISIHVIWTSQTFSDNITISTSGAAEELEGSGETVNGYKQFLYKLSGEAVFTVNTWTCVPRGTCITMADGYYKEIQDIKAGDLVCSVDESLQVKIAKVYKLVKGKTKELVSMTLESGNILTMTRTHPVLTMSGYKTYDGYTDKPDTKLQVGDAILCDTGTLKITDLILTAFDEFVQVYTLLVIDQNASEPDADPTADLTAAEDIDSKLYTNWLPYFAGTALSVTHGGGQHSGGSG